MSGELIMRSFRLDLSNFAIDLRLKIFVYLSNASVVSMR